MITRLSATLAISALLVFGANSPAGAEPPADPAAGAPTETTTETTPETATETATGAAAPSPQDAELESAAQAAKKVTITGPKDVAVAGQGVIHLPGGYQYIPQPEAGKLSHAFGNPMSASLVGLIFPSSDANWVANLHYVGDGYVKDDDAKIWNPDELLQSLRDGTEAANADRTARGFEAIEVAGWVEKPFYDASAHRLVWSALGRPKGATGNDGSVNYNTYALGREGHFELNLISSPDTIEGNKVHARTLLGALAFDDGKRYQDFNASTDKVAAYGLAALVGGVAAKKLGLLAVMFGFAAKFAKLIAVAAVAGLVGLKRLFGGRSGQA